MGDLRIMDASARDLTSFEALGRLVRAAALQATGLHLAGQACEAADEVSMSEAVPGAEDRS